MIRNKNIEKIKVKSIAYFLLFLYFIAISAYQLGTGFDAIFVRGTFVLLFIVSIIYKRKIKITRQLKWCLLFWGFYFLSVIWANNISDTLYYIDNFFQILGLTIILPNLIENEKDVYKVLKIFIFSMLYTSILLLLRTPSDAWGTERLGECIGLSPNGAGLRLAVASTLSLFSAHDIFDNKKLEKRNIKMIFYILLFALFFVILLFTGSKKALFVFVFGVIAFELISAKGYTFFRKIVFACLIIGIVGFLIFNNEKLYSVIGKRVENMYLTIVDPNRSTQIDTSLIERNFYIQHAKALFGEYPIFGYGGNNFVTRMREISYSHVAYSHNNYFELLCTLGIIGFSIYYSYWFNTLFILIKKNINKKSNINLIFLIILISLLFTDYGNVSYVIEFNSAILIIINIFIEQSREKKYEKNT